jgi:hypothetical protein
MKLADRIYQLPTQEEQDQAADKARGWDGMGWNEEMVGLCGADSMLVLTPLFLPSFPIYFVCVCVCVQATKVWNRLLKVLNAAEVKGREGKGREAGAADGGVWEGAQMFTNPCTLLHTPRHDAMHAPHITGATGVDGGDAAEDGGAGGRGGRPVLLPPRPRAHRGRARGAFLPFLSGLGKMGRGRGEEGRGSKGLGLIAQPTLLPCLAHISHNTPAMQCDAMRTDAMRCDAMRCDGMGCRRC